MFKESQNKLCTRSFNSMMTSAERTVPFIFTEQLPPGNRAERRRLRGQQANSSLVVQSEIFRMGRVIKDGFERNSRVVGQFGGSLVSIVFQGEPFIQGLLEAQRELPDILRRAQRLNTEIRFAPPEYLNQFDRVNSFEKRIIGGTSLLDIEQMELDENGKLNPNDIGRINRLLRVPRWRGIFERLGLKYESPWENHIRQSIVFFASQDLARPEERIATPRNLRPLKARLMAYFDFYTNLMLGPAVDDWEDTLLTWTLSWNAPWLPQSLGVYIPARLDISPSSAIKLFQTRARVSIVPYLSWRRGILPFMEKEAKDAFREGSLPEDLKPYQLFDGEVDDRAMVQLLDHYRRQNLTQSEISENYDQLDNLLSRFGKLYFRLLQQDIERSKQRKMETEFSGNHPVSKLVVTSQNRKVLMFILLFQDRKTHLTLEIDREQRAFGLPPRLETDHPNIVPLILNDTLESLLAFAKQKYPNVEPEKKQPANSTQRVKLRILEPEPLAYIPRPKEPAPSRRLTILTPIQRTLMEPRLPSALNPSTRQYVVMHSRDQINSFLGERVQEKTIEGLMGEIRDFEHGTARAKILEGVGGLWELRYGHYRIVLEHTRGRFFNVVALDRRDRIFRREAVSPGKFG